MILWTLSYILPGASTPVGPASLASLGLARPRRRLVSQAASTLALTADGSNADAASLLPFGTTVMMFRNGVQWFYGVVTKTPSQASGRGESQDYEISDPWWFLENLVYQQQWIAPTYPGANTTNDPYRSHCFLNRWVYNATGNYYSRTPTDQQIQDVVAFAKTFNTIPLQLPATPGLIPSMDIPIEEVRDITCSEVIRKQLRWMPDAVTYFDYSTTPPTLWILRRAALAPVSVPFPIPGSPPSSPLSSFRINPRYDLYHPSVAVKFERVDKVNQIFWLDLIPQVYPPTATGHELQALVLTVELEGLNDRVVSGAIDVGATSTATVGTQIANLGAYDPWWLDKQPWLQRCSTATITNLSYQTADGSGLPLDDAENPYNNELLSGQIAPWMNYLAEECTVTAVINYTINQPASGDPPDGPFTGPVAKIGSQSVSVKVQMTNAPAGEQTLYSLANSISAEQVPSTLAQTLYQSVGFVPYEGSITLVEPECGGLVGIGNTLNLTGSQQSAWAAMNTVVQQVVENLETGETTIAFGPPSHLGAPDLIELLRLNRFRVIYSNPAAQIQSAQVEGQTELGQQTALENSVAAGSTYQQFGVQGLWIAPAGGGAATLSGGPLSSTLPAPPSTTPATTADPAQGTGQMKGASIALGPVPAKSSLPSGITANAATTDTSAWVLLRTCDLKGSDGYYHPLYAQEVAICIGGTQYSTMILCSAPFTPGS